jgi:hypothetical protein
MNIFEKAFNEVFLFPALDTSPISSFPDKVNHISELVELEKSG